MKVTSAWLKKHRACPSGRAWFNGQTASEHLDVIRGLVKQRRPEWALWLCLHMLSNPKNIRALNIYAAKLAAPAFRKAEGDASLRLRFSKMLDDVKHARYSLANRKAGYLTRHSGSLLGYVVAAAFYHATLRVPCAHEHRAFWSLNFALNAAYNLGATPGRRTSLRIIKRGLELVGKEEKSELVKPRHRH